MLFNESLENNRTADTRLVLQLFDRTSGGVSVVVYIALCLCVSRANSNVYLHDVDGVGRHVKTAETSKFGATYFEPSTFGRSVGHLLIFEALTHLNIE